MKNKKNLWFKILKFTAGFDRIGANLTRLGLVVVTVWIGLLKVAKYEAEGIVAFTANSPLFSWMLRYPHDYKSHKNPEGVVNAVNQAWHTANGTYFSALVIGAIIVLLGLLIAAGWIHPLASMVGGILLAGMSLVTLSFLLTTPEVWVADLGSSTHGFPFLAAPGRLVVKDSIMLGASIWVAADSARLILHRSNRNLP
ncbi:MAG: YkgB family protein [Rothia sp. (in: high G+C Gram-positive bacteria)]|nr:YkgB family protein [Rothia sp. (in: high G+C Gram-positive bacteria)]